MGEAGLGETRLEDAGLAKPSMNGASKKESGSKAGAAEAVSGDAGTLADGSYTGGAGGVLRAGWSWPALAAFLVPGIAFAIAMAVS
jgi:hypothetical protein